MSFSDTAETFNYFRVPIGAQSGHFNGRYIIVFLEKGIRKMLRGESVNNRARLRSARSIIIYYIHFPLGHSLLGSMNKKFERRNLILPACLSTLPVPACNLTIP